MRFLLICLLLVTASASYSQKWKSYILSPRGDTLNCVDQNGLKQGPWVTHMDPLRGEQGYDEQGYYIDDKKDGVWVRFTLEGDKIAAETYRWGNLDGKSQYFTRTGGLVREENWRAVDPTKTYDTVDVVDMYDPSKVVDRVIVKLEGTTYKHGKWTYYDVQMGTIDKTENWFMGKQKNEDGSDYADKELQPLERKQVDKSTLQKPQAVLDFEKKNSGKKKIKSRDGNTGM
jgi:hypothetical protein